MGWNMISILVNHRNKQLKKAKARKKIQNIKDIQKIRELLTLFDYKNKNLTKEQRNLIEKIGDIVHQTKYDIEVKVNE